MFLQFLPNLGFVPPAPPGTTGYVAVSNPGWLAYDPTQKLVWVANGTNVLGINPLTLATVVASATFSVITQIAYDITQNVVWVADSANNSIKSISTATGAVVTAVSLTVSPVSCVYDPVDNNVWYTDSTSKIGRFNAATGAVVATLTAPLFGSNRATSFETVDSYLLFIGNTSGNTQLQYVNSATNTVYALPSATGLSGGVQTACFFDPAHYAIWTCVTTPNGLIKYDIASNSISTSISTTPVPVSVSLDGTNNLWACLGTGFNQYNPVTGALLNSVAINATLNSVYDPVNHRMWATSNVSPVGLYYYQQP